MSTKATIAYGPNCHFYHEAFDDDHVYLEVEGAQFEAGYNRVIVPIPVHMWEVIRQYTGVDLSCAEQTDEELQQYVEQEVDERIKRYQEAQENAKGLGDFRERLYPHARQSITIQNSLNWANTSGFNCSKTGYSFQEIALVSLFGALAYGAADEPRGKQIGEGRAHFRKVREQQRQIKAAIVELEGQNRRK